MPLVTVVLVVDGPQNRHSLNRLRNPTAVAQPGDRNARPDGLPPRRLKDEIRD